MLPKPISQPLNLLLVEDNLPDIVLVREAIKAEHLSIAIYLAEDGERAVDFFSSAENNPEAPSPHLVILDLNLPRIDGFEVLRRIRASNKYHNVPVLVITASNSSSDQNAIVMLGARYFRKPVTYESFALLGPFLRRFLEENGLL